MDGTPLQTEFDDERSTIVREPREAKASSTSRKFPLVGCSVVGLLALIAIGVVIGVIFLIRDSSKGTTNQANTSSNVDSNVVNKQIVNLQEQQNEIEKQKQQLANEQKIIDNKKKSTPANVNAPAAADPPTARITFHRGSVEETISGSVVKRRGYVLRTLSGQSLSADLHSAGDCVVFSNGSSSESYITSQGDSSLAIINNCGSPASFTLTVSVR
jgi:cytoskeletal protein RodZ